MDDSKRRFQRNAKSGLMSDYGMKIHSPEPGSAIGEMEIQERMLNPYGAIHGGVLFALADTVGGSAAMSRGFYIVTSTGSIHYLRGTHRSRRITAKAEEVKYGKTLSIYDIDMIDEYGKLVAKATMTYCSTGVAVDESEEIRY